LGFTQRLTADETTHVPPVTPTDGCALRVNLIEGSDSNVVLRAVAKKIVTTVPAALLLRAEGHPPGGTYAWPISPPSETNKFTSLGCDAVYTVTEAVKGVRVQVEYACPDGKRIIGKFPINIIDNTAKK
jgi:hypothetical protein